jgi:hypothetical protein
MTDLHPWQVSNRSLTGKLQQPLDSCFVFRTPGAGEEVIRLNKEGFHYRGQFIEDAGEAHRLMVGFLRQGTVPAVAAQPVALKEQALKALEQLLQDPEAGCFAAAPDTIRRALEALPND